MRESFAIQSILGAVLVMASMLATINFFAPTKFEKERRYLFEALVDCDTQQCVAVVEERIRVLDKEEKNVR